MRPAYFSFALAVLGFLCLAKGHLPPPPCKYYNPCRNGGVCIENYWGTRCQCIGPYTGKRCETAINACLSNPCLGRGTCAVGSQNPRHWYCICPPGKTGLRCEKVIHDCTSEPCQNGGSCCENQNGYTCDCKPGFTGNYCETDIDECLSEPCQNGGTCVDQVNGYSCSCRVGLEGRHCERKKPGCHNSTCLNGGSCAESSDRMWYCVCPKTHKGIQCEQQVNDCSSHPCQNGGSCCDKGNRYECKCPDGYTGKHCETEIISPSSTSTVMSSSSRTPCVPNPCRNGGTCVYLGGSRFFCQCPLGHSGMFCDRISMCNCQNGGTCHSYPYPSCACPSPYTGRVCETHYCDTSDACARRGICIKSPNAFKCICPLPYTGPTCYQIISTVQVSSTSADLCSSPGNICGPFASCSRLNNYQYSCYTPSTTFTPTPAWSTTSPVSKYCPCQNGGACYSYFPDVSCSCPYPFTGTYCETHYCDIQVPCHNGGTCIKSPNAFTCICPSPFTGQMCDDVISTSTVTSSAACCVPNHGTCVVSASQSASCSCYSLFYYGPRCEFEHNPCTRSPCGSMASCSKIAADLYTCISSSVAMTPSTTLTWSSSGARSISPSPSSSMTPTTTLTSSSTATPTTSPCGCLNGGTCLSNGECYCPIGLGGPKCGYYTDYCLCNPCMNGGTCREQREGYSCSCRPGFYGSKCASGTSSWTTTILSIRSISPSPSSSCSCVHGICVSATCFCGLVYYGPRCEYEHNPCTRMYACPSSMSCSKISGDQYTCLSLTPTPTLTSSSTATPTIIYDHICDISSPCRHGQCIKIPTSPYYRCQCDPGYFGFLCQTPALSTPTVSSSSASPCGCLNGGTCLSNGECYCPIGLGGPKCGYYTDYCLCNPCMNGGTCREQREGYSCSCRPGFYGSKCASASVVTHSPSNTLRTTTPPLRWTGHSHNPAPRTSEYRTTTVLTATTSLPPTSSASNSVVMKKRSRRESKKNDEITEVEDKELERICKLNKRKARKFFINKQVDKKTWNKLHPGIQSVLIDLVANNDHRRLSGTHAQIKNAVAQNDLRKMAQIMADRSLWKRVPVARYWKRKQMMKKAVKKPWSSLVTSEVVC